MIGKITFPFCRFVSFFGWMLKGVVWDVPNAVQTFSTSFSITLMSLKWFWNWLIQIVSRGSWKQTRTNQKKVTFQLKLKSKQRYQSGGLGIDFLTLLIQIKIQFAISNQRVYYVMLYSRREKHSVKWPFFMEKTNASAEVLIAIVQNRVVGLRKVFEIGVEWSLRARPCRY